HFFIPISLHDALPIYTPFNVAIINSFAVHLKFSTITWTGLLLPTINSSAGTCVGVAGHIGCPYLLLAYIMAQVVKINDDVNPGIDRKSTRLNSSHQII